MDWGNVDEAQVNLINATFLRISSCILCEILTDKKEKKIFLIYNEIQSGAVAKSFMRKDFLVCEDLRKYFPIYEEAFSHI